MFLNEAGKHMTGVSTDQSAQSRHKRKGKKKKHNGTDNSNVLENPPPPQRSQTNRTHRPSRQLEFNQAMEDFSNMFPGLDRDVIESVLRSNNGAIDVTIDQLLILDQDTDSQEDLTPGTPDSNQMFLGSSFPMSNHLPLFGQDQPPPYSPPSPNSPYSQFNTKPTNQESVLPQESGLVVRPSPLGDIQDPFSLSSYPPLLPPRSKQYKPALLGPLPDDFLRLPTPQTEQLPQEGVTRGAHHRPEELSRMTNGQPRNERRNRSEEEKLALLLQSDAFIEELKKNAELMASIDRDYAHANPGSDTLIPHEGAIGGFSVVNVDIRTKLPYMSKATKTKLSSVVKKYNKKKKKSARINSPGDNLPAQSAPPPQAFGPPRRLNDRSKRQAEANLYDSVNPISPHGS